MLSLSARTVSRMVKDGRLPRLKGVRHILIPASQLEQWVEDNSVYNPYCSKPSKSGDHSWIRERSKKVSTLTAKSGTHLTQTQAVEELDALLALS